MKKSDAEKKHLNTVVEKTNFKVFCSLTITQAEYGYHHQGHGCPYQQPHQKSRSEIHCEFHDSARRQKKLT